MCNAVTHCVTDLVASAVGRGNGHRSRCGSLVALAQNLRRAAARTFSAMAPKKDDKKKDPKGKGAEAEPEGKSTNPLNPSPKFEGSAHDGKG